MDGVALRRKSPPPGGQLQSAVTLAGNAGWALYRGFLSGAVARVVPVRTRDAAFQLFCDLRANTPKDSRFLARHARAFTPATRRGWLALAATLGYSASALLLLCTLTVGLSVAGVWAGVVAALAAGAFLASALSLIGLLMLGGALGVGAVGCVALCGYAGASAALAVMHYISALVFGAQQQHEAAPGWAAAEREAAAPAAAPVLPLIKTKPPGTCGKHRLSNGDAAPSVPLAAGSPPLAGGGAAPARAATPPLREAEPAGRSPDTQQLRRGSSPGSSPVDSSDSPDGPLSTLGGASPADVAP
jgi:hypothetical protein